MRRHRRQLPRGARAFPAPGFPLAFAILLTGCGRTEPPSVPIGPAAGSRPDSPVKAAEWFADVTERSGIRFRHRAGTNYFMPDQVGSGIAVLDVDGDGRLDLYFVQNAGPRGGARNQFHRQESDGIFRDISAGSGADLDGPGMGAIAGDVNNDGRPDLVVTQYGATRLLVNQGGGRFAEAGPGSGIDNPRWAAPASFIDYDHDGLGDVFVTHLTEEFHALLRQDRRGWFTDDIARSGLQEQGWRGTGFGVVLEDFDVDGAPDLAFVNGLVRRATPAQTPVLAAIDPWWARYAQRSTLNAQRSTLNAQRSTLNAQRSTLRGGGSKSAEQRRRTPACQRAKAGRSLADDRRGRAFRFPGAGQRNRGAFLRAEGGPVGSGRPDHQEAPGRVEHQLRAGRHRGGAWSR